MNPGEPRVQDMINAARGSVKCRIPQKLPAVHQKPDNKPNVSVNSKSAVVSAPHSRFPSMPSSRPLSGEQARPKTTGRTKDVIPPKQHGCLGTWSAVRPEKGRSTGIKVQRPSIIPKRIANEPTVSKMSRQFITVPVTQKQPTKTLYTNKTITCIPDQETIKRHEDLELHQDSLCVSSPCTDLNDEESITSQSDGVRQLKLTWLEKTKRFEEMKHELKDRQKAIMEMHAALGMTQQRMSALGQQVSLPPADELCFMNLANLAPDQFLQLCANDLDADARELEDVATPLDIDKLYNMPSKLVGTCEHTLVKRQEIIDTLEAMTTKKDISLHQFLKKIKEFNTENKMLARSLEKVKDEFFVDLGEIVTFIKKCVNNYNTAQLQNKQLVNQISELNAEKDEIRKKTHNTDHFRTNVHNKSKIEELEKQLKEEKSKRTMLRDRLNRAEGQVKITTEQASHLEAALEQSQSKNWNLERTVQQLREQNQKLQDDFDKEQKTNTESLRVNAANLEEIAEAGEKLRAEKEDLEKRLTELSVNYTQSLKNVKQEINSKVVHVIEMEKRYEDEKDAKQKLENKVESLCSQLLESELRCKDVCKQLQEKESQLSKTMECSKELEMAKHNLAEADKEMDGYRNRLAEQSEAVREIEHNFKEAIKLENDLRKDLKNKNEYISELKNKLALLEQQLQESEKKMMSYDEELRILKTHLAQFQEDFGEFDNLNDLKEMINKQRGKLLEATRQNGELAEALQKKDFELDRLVEQIAEQENVIEQKESIIKMLSDKEGEYAKIIKLLQNNLEMRSQADMDFNQQLSDKRGEIESLITNIETKKQQIDNLEKIILTLEDQTRKASTQRRKDQEKIMYLENKVAEYEAYNLERKQSLEGPENLDNIIKMLENEIGALDTEPSQKELLQYSKKNNARNRVKYSKPEKYEDHEGSSRLPMYEGHEKVAAKIKYDTFALKAYDEQKGDNLDRKQAKTSINTQKHSCQDPGINVYDVPPPTHKNIASRGKTQSRLKDVFLPKNLNVLAPAHFREDKKPKMYRLVRHRL